MNIHVCIKQVPDLNAPIRIAEGELARDMDRMVLNAYDASALEEALVLAEAHGGEVEVVLIGSEKASDVIRKALAMGASKGTHIVTDLDADFDSSSYAAILAAWFRELNIEYIFTGKQSQDTDAGLTGGMLAAHLGIPWASNAVAIESDGDNLTVTRQGDSGREVLELPAPGLVTCSNDMNEPRIPNLKGIMQSKKKPVDQIPLTELFPDTDKLAGRTRILSYEEKPARKAGEKLEGEPGELAVRVARLLAEKENLIG
ncbi:MAG: electron transfer flavoprotein subunit beta/FixA family protein [Balneolaceae bacterium]